MQFRVSVVHLVASALREPSDVGRSASGKIIGAFTRAACCVISIIPRAWSAAPLNWGL